MNDPLFIYRLGFGLTALSVFAAYDYIKHPGNPKRIKEYGFLFGVSICAMVYGVFHDVVTYHISPEYFSIGKDIPEAENGFCVEVLFLALQASWSAGLFVGLVMLIANNPSRKRPQLPYTTLGRRLILPLGFSIALAAAFGIAGIFTADWIGSSNKLYVLDLRDTKSFVVVSLIHAGTYIGAFIGTILTAMVIARKRRKLVGVELNPVCLV